MQEIPTIGYDGSHHLTQVDYDLGTTQSEVFVYDAERSEAERAATGKVGTEADVRPAFRRHWHLD